MKDEMTRKAQEYVAAHKDQLIRQAIDYYMPADEDLADKMMMERYERMLCTMAQTENDKAAAAAYMIIALDDQTDGVFSKAKGIRWVLLADAFDVFEKLLQETCEGYVLDEVYDQYRKEVSLLAWEAAHGMITFEE